MTRVKESPELLAFNAAAPPVGFEKVKIVRADGPTLRFHGKVRAENVAGKGSRRIEIALWETPAGAWVAAQRNVDEPDAIERAIVISPDQVLAGEGPIMAMDFWTWGAAARALARSMGWRFEEFVA